MMARYTTAIMAAALLAASTGCSQTGAIVRGQNPGVTQAIAYEAQDQQSRQQQPIQPLAYPIKQLAQPSYHPHQPAAAVRELGNHIHEHVNATRTTYHSDAGFPGLDGQGYGGQGYGEGACPTGGCPAGAHPGAACPGGACPGGAYGGCQPGGPNGWLCHQRAPQVKHYNTYGYTAPKNLSYPAPNATGGAVVYPYYTHKGPSDFFTK